jgi:hypothetical protein
MIQQNITVKGMSWDEHADLNNHGTSLRTHPVELGVDYIADARHRNSHSLFSTHA